ncbi:KEOPS complex subunit Pcc1 [Methanoregula sp.]|uniref:KEOPS complex subunit Pcc1 n=1 Tax=Methanoregula sp. TaxID=2052170 RepID=UPI00261EA313|nr:KEOPS complex subunit Pcc1 [Methanoregula sp.]MDD5142827.1 KEOPS complex subunit Pcc1 [Methanoregula sp.]
MPQHEAVFRFTTEHAENIYRSLLPELEDEVNPRSSVSCRLEGCDTLVLTVTAQDTSSLRAALNMYLRLVTVADEVTGIAQNHEPRDTSGPVSKE